MSQVTTIIGIKIASGLDFTPRLQEILSHYSCAIRTRIGLHEADDFKCASYGIILLQVVDDSIVAYLQNDLLDIDGVEIQTMKFN